MKNLSLIVDGWINLYAPQATVEQVEALKDTLSINIKNHVKDSIAQARYKQNKAIKEIKQEDFKL